MRTKVLQIDIDMQYAYDIRILQVTTEANTIF